MDIKQIFEEAIARQERIILQETFRFPDETQEEVDAKNARRIKMVCVGMGHASQFSDINLICPGQDVNWEGFRINRRRVDQLDNIYVSRI